MSNTKGNRQFKETHAAILGAVLELLGDKELKRITVAEVCRKVGVNRSTFYEHYLDIYDVIESTEAEYAAQMAALISESLCASREKAAIVALGFVREHQEFYGRFAGMGREIGIPDGLLGIDLSQRKVSVLADGGMAPDAAAYRLGFLRGGINAIVRIWLEGGCREREEELVDMMHPFLHAC